MKAFVFIPIAFAVLLAFYLFVEITAALTGTKSPWSNDEDDDL